MSFKENFKISYFLPTVLALFGLALIFVPVTYDRFLGNHAVGTVSEENIETSWTLPSPIIPKVIDPQSVLRETETTISKLQT
jgi:hypothetical protein